MASDVVQVDVAVIGAGTAGLTARRAAAKAGARTLLIEAGPWGTTCVRTGCMPSKLLLSAARAARDARNANVFGVHAGPVRIDGRAVMARVQAQRDHFLRSIYDELDEIPATEKIEGRARFVGPNSLSIDDHLLVQAKAVVIATGSSSSIPKSIEPVRDRVLTNESVFKLKDLPGSIAVVGAGPLGIELAAAFVRLGVRVMVFAEGHTIGGLKDPEVGRAARELMATELDLKLGVRLEAVSCPGGARLRWTGPEGDGEAEFERVLVAAGRSPNLSDLGLETAGLEVDEHGVPRHDRATLRCGTSTVFIAGDADRDLPVLHEASRQGTLAGRNAARIPDLACVTPPAALSVVFTDPDMASIGQPLQTLGTGGAVGSCDFKAGRGRIENRSGGMIRLYAHRQDGIIAGGEMVGPGVEHLAHLVAFMVQQRMTVELALRLPFYHPTFEEDLKDCLRDLAYQFGAPQ